MNWGLMYLHVSDVLYAPDSASTNQLVRELWSCGSMGKFALLLFLAQKYCRLDKSCSELIRVQLPCDIAPRELKNSLATVSLWLNYYTLKSVLRWGWSKDNNLRAKPWMLSVDLPTGPIILRSAKRCIGPDSFLENVRANTSEHRIIKYCAHLLMQANTMNKPD